MEARRWRIHYTSVPWNANQPNLLLRQLPRAAFERLGVVFPELPRIVRLVARQRLERMGVSLSDISSDGDGSDAVRLLEDLFASPDVRMLAQRMLSAESSPALSPALSPRE